MKIMYSIYREKKTPEIIQQYERKQRKKIQKKII